MELARLVHCSECNSSAYPLYDRLGMEVRYWKRSRFAAGFETLVHYRGYNSTVSLSCGHCYTRERSECFLRYSGFASLVHCSECNNTACPLYDRFRMKERCYYALHSAELAGCNY